MEARIISFDYFYEKGESRRLIEPYFVIFQWTSWYVFGFCTQRNDWRMFKLTRLWNFASEEKFSPREIPPDKKNFNAHFTEDKKFVALFDHSVKYQLIESYGLNCYKETDDGLLLEIKFTNRDFIIAWLLGFGGKVKILEPKDIADEIKIAAQKILSNYK
jgi:predicted DNA-binding transcriptional regulator YafY